MSTVRAELARWDKPTLICFSDGDPIFPYPVAGELFTQLIPGPASRWHQGRRPLRAGGRGAAAAGGDGRRHGARIRARAGPS